MYWRQKALLHMLLVAARPVSRLELMKWAFLLSRETPSGGGSAFYDFVPYHYGPFSFGLYQEVSKLVDAGLVQEPTPQTWTASPGVLECTRDLPAPLRQDAARTVQRLGGAPLRDVIDYVYEKYPWFTINSRRRQLPRPAAIAAVYTLGYEGVSVDAFLNTLVWSGLTAIIDVRHSALSRRYGFHGRTLSGLCGRLGIAYTHLPELGVPPSTRQSWRQAADLSELMDAYEERVEARQNAAVQAATALMAEHPSALVCMEAEPGRCHRSRLARLIARRSGLEVQHLRIERCSQAA